MTVESASQAIILRLECLTLSAPLRQRAHEYKDANAQRHSALRSIGAHRCANQARRRNANV